jgi:hypothetical protein
MRVCTGNSSGHSEQVILTRSLLTITMPVIINKRMSSDDPGHHQVIIRSSPGQYQVVSSSSFINFIDIPRNSPRPSASGSSDGDSPNTGA